MDRSEQDYVVDPARTTLGWAVRHAFGVGWVRGAFTDVEGTVEMVGGVSVTARATIRVEPFGTGNPRRDAHLRSPDFFWVERHPTIAFASDRIEPVGDDTYRILGTLTVRGNATRIALDARVEGRSGGTGGRGRWTVRMTGTLDRKDVGMMWSRGIGPFQLAYDEVRLDLTVSLVPHIVSTSARAGHGISGVETSPPGPQERRS